MAGAVAAWMLLVWAQVSPPAATPDHLTPHHPVERNLAPGRAEIFEVAVKAGQFIHVVVEQKRIDMELAILDPDGGEAASAHNRNGFFGWEHASTIASRAGVFRVKVTSAETRRTGAYRIELVALGRPSAKDRLRLEAERLVRGAAGQGPSTDANRRLAIENGSRAAALFEELGDFYDAALARQRLAGLHTELSEIHEAADCRRRALDAFERELTLRRRLHDRFAEASLLESIAGIYSDLQQLPQQFDYYQRALAVWRSASDRAGEAGLFHTRAMAYKYVGDKQKSLEDYQQSLAIRRALKDRFMEGVVLNNIGNVYNDLNRNQDALDALGQSLAIWSELGDRQKEAGTGTNIGLIYANLGNPGKALEYYERALPVAHNATTLINIGLAYSDLGDQQKALDYYQQAIAAGVSTFGKATALLNMGESYRELGDFQKALDCYNQALPIWRSIGERHGEALTLANSGRLHAARGNLSQALENYRRALPVWREFGDRAREASTLNNLSELFASSDPDLAILFGKQSVNVIQTIRSDNSGLDAGVRRGYDKSVESYYRSLADLLISRERFGEAEEVLNLLKDKETADRVQRDSVSDSLRPATLLDSEKQALARYDEIVGKIVVLGQRKSALVASREHALTGADLAESERLDRDLADADLVFERFFDEQSKVFSADSSLARRVTEIKEAEGLQDTLQQLGPGVVAIYTLVAPDRYVAMLVTSGARKAYTTSIREAELNRKIFEFRGRLQDPSSDPVPLARELYAIVFPEGLRQDLDAIHAETLMWSIDGALRYVPVAALHDGHDYLVRRFRNSLITPASLSRLTQNPEREWRGAGFGVSDGNPPLPSVPLELKSVFREQGRDGPGVIPGTVRLNSEFTRTAFEGDLRRQRNTVVHIATHFDSRPGSASSSHLLLGDGELSLAEIEAQARLFSGVDLLTLSACNTAFSNRNEDGREVDSFGTIAQRLGALGVVASLWSVNDPATASLMERMYRFRQRNGMPKGEALRQAQIAMLDDDQPVREASDRGVRQTGMRAAGRWSHPFYWAPFILIGNWK